VRLLHDLPRISALFDDPNLVSRAGLVPVMGLAERAGLRALVREHVTVSAKAGVFPEVKAVCLVAGMAAGADSIVDMGVLRHGAMTDLFGGIWAPSTLGSFLRSLTWGNVRQLEKVSRLLLAQLAERVPQFGVLLGHRAVVDGAGEEVGDRAGHVVETRPDRREHLVGHRPQPRGDPRPPALADRDDRDRDEGQHHDGGQRAAGPPRLGHPVPPGPVSATKR